jgi:hypothetical protein
MLSLNNHTFLGNGECPACGASIHVIGSASELRLRWCCVACNTVGSAPFLPAVPAPTAEDLELAAISC